MSSSCLDLNIRSYGVSHAAHSHGFDQLVLPLDGNLLIEVDGHEDRLAPGRIAVVPRGERHTQTACSANRSLILDLAPPGNLDAARLPHAIFIDVSPATWRLIEFMGLSFAAGSTSPTLQAHWTDLLLESLGQPPQPRSRLAVLLAAVERSPGETWSLPRLAALAHLSTSRLHAVFRETLACSPMEWVTRQRMRLARDLLSRTELAVGEVAWRCGYADQSAFTRAFTRATGQTPVTLRRAQRQ